MVNKIYLLLLFVFITFVSHAQTLEEAIQKKDTALAAKLISQGSDPNQKDKYGTTLLMGACHFADVAMARFLLAHGAGVNDPRSPKGRTPLMVACAYWSGMNMVELLVDKGADVNITSTDGTTALMLAASLEKIEVVNYLLAHGANVAAKNNAGQTALDLAVNGKVEDYMKNIKDIKFDREKTIESLKAAMGK